MRRLASRRATGSPGIRRRGKTTGRVVEKLTSDRRGRESRAEGDQGVRLGERSALRCSDKTGMRAAHRPEALERRGS